MEARVEANFSFEAGVEANQEITNFQTRHKVAPRQLLLVKDTGETHLRHDVDISCVAKLFYFWHNIQIS